MNKTPLALPRSERLIIWVASTVTGVYLLTYFVLLMLRWQAATRLEQLINILIPLVEVCAHFLIASYYRRKQAANAD